MGSTKETHVSVLARRYIETLEARRLDECMSLFRDDAVVHFPKTLNAQVQVSKEEFRAALGGIDKVFRICPRYRLLQQTSEGDRSCIEFRGVGTLGDGTPFDNLYCLVFVAKDGLIAELREYLDTHYMLTIFKGAAAATASSTW